MTLLISLLLLLLCKYTVCPVPTRVQIFDLTSNPSVETQVITSLAVYRDELVVLGVFAGVFTLNSAGLNINSTSLRDITLDQTFVTVDNTNSILAVCTNAMGRCMWSKVSEINNKLGEANGLLLAGQIDQDIDPQVVVILANTNTSYTSIITASSNNIITGQTVDVETIFPIKANQIDSSYTAVFEGVPITNLIVRYYIAAHVYGNYVYITALNENSGDSRVVRMCQSDNLDTNRFHSLYEAILAPCGGMGYFITSSYITILPGLSGAYLVASFISQTGGGNPLVCAYSLSEINSRMEQGFNNCVIARDPMIDATLGWNSGFQCNLYDGTTTVTECNLWPVSNISASVILRVAEIQAVGETSILNNSPIISRQLPGILYDRMIATQIDQHYYIYIAQSNNIISKHYIASNITGVLIEEYTLDNTVTGLETDSSGTMVYASTIQAVYKIPVEDCGRYTDCISCTADVDPICGWCSVTNTCSRRSQCADSALTHRWINDNTTNCFTLRSITPVISPINVQQTVTLEVTNLPEQPSNDAYQCVFPGFNTANIVNISGVTSNSNNTMLYGPTYGNTSITCQLPTGIPTPSNQDIEVSPVYLTSTASAGSMLYGQLSYTVYDCSVHSTCTDCITTNSSCGWCVYDNTCTYTSALCANNAWIVPSGTIGECPLIQTTTTYNISAGENVNLTLAVSNLAPAIAGYTYTCQIAISSSVSNHNAVLHNNSIICNIDGSSITTGIGDITVHWGPQLFSIPKQGNIQVSVVNCMSQGSDCGACLLSDSTGVCGWCTGTNNAAGTCSSQLGCDVSSFITGSDANCPAAVLDKYWPVTSPTEGSTTITLIGYNFGNNINRVSISIANTACVIQSFNDTQLSCILSAPATQSSSSIQITIRNSTLPARAYSIYTPNITSIYPSYTPAHGGTAIQVSGYYLNIGNSVALLYRQLPCVINSTTTQGDLVNITCVTTQTQQDTQIGPALFSANIDSSPFIYTEGEFEVLSNPEVDQISPTSAVHAGVQDYVLTGRNLGATLSVILRFSRISNNELLSKSVCITPDPPMNRTLRCPGMAFSNTLGTNEDIKFDLIMDAVPNITAFYFSSNTFTLYTNPVVIGDGIIYYNKGERDDDDSGDISIPIKNIMQIPLSEITVRMKGSNSPLCNTVFLGTDSISCQLLQYIIDNEQSYPSEVVIGRNANQYSIEFTVEVTAATLLDQIKKNQIPIGIAGGAILLILVASCVVCCCICCIMWRVCRRIYTKKEEAQALLNNMEEMENDMAEECRRNFAELNTHIGIEGEALQISTVPFNDFITFAMRILFPGELDHPVLHPPQCPSSVNEQTFYVSINEFNNLLHNKQFLLAMIHGMEESKCFGTRDRCNIASLLTICLHRDMNYMTDILFTLLRELIDKNMSRNTAKLLLRRTESVAEKLLADWLAFNLYASLKGPIGISFYTLYRGIKAHLENGPIDVLTGQAKNSLSEDKLLRTNLYFEVLEVVVELENGGTIPCKVLDCDSVTQAKMKVLEKIYMKEGYSEMPKLEDVDLEVRAGSAALPLRDNDITSVVDEDWRAINTLKHYKIYPYAKFRIVPRKHKPSPGQVWDYPGCIIYDFYTIRNATFSFEDETPLTYHLTKNEPEEIDYDTGKGLGLNTVKRTQYASEIYLTRLVHTKRVLQGYVEQMFSSIFPDYTTTTPIPMAIKYLYDFLDSMAAYYGVTDTDVVHTWKSNSVPLRFWVNILKNPDFLMNVSKSASLDSCLTVISQAFIDSCSTSNTVITKDSPATKLLYHRDVQGYKKRVANNYASIKATPPPYDTNLHFNIDEMSTEPQAATFNLESAAYGLYCYANTYQNNIQIKLGEASLNRELEVFDRICLDLTENLYN